MVNLIPRVHMAMSGDTIGCHNGQSATGIWWGEARDAARYPTKPRTARTTKNSLTENVDSTTVE